MDALEINKDVVAWEAGAVAWVLRLVVCFFCSHTSQFNASNRKWITAEVLHSAHQYTQEQRDGVKT